jgi:pimeloyl-ACP methyl ester carboxylesterase
MDLVLLPGMDGTGVLFEPFVAALPPPLRPIVVRYPGDLAADYAGHVEFARAALPRGRPFVLLGESFSGPVAVSLAAERPLGLVGVVLCSTFATNPIRWAPRAARVLVKPLLFRTAPAAARLRMLAGRDATPELDALLRRAHEIVTPAALAARARAVLGVDVRARLRAVERRVLCLHGTRDRVVPRRALTELVRTAPDARARLVDAPHLLLQVAPEDCAESVAAFVRAFESDAGLTTPPCC